MVKKTTILRPATDVATRKTSLVDSAAGFFLLDRSRIQYAGDVGTRELPNITASFAGKGYSARVDNAAETFALPVGSGAMSIG